MKEKPQAAARTTVTMGWGNGEKGSSMPAMFVTIYHCMPITLEQHAVFTGIPKATLCILLAWDMKVSKAYLDFTLTALGRV